MVYCRYNGFRPHSALGILTPNEAWNGQAGRNADTPVCALRGQDCPRYRPTTPPTPPSQAAPEPLPIRAGNPPQFIIKIARQKCRGHPRLPVIPITVRHHHLHLHVALVAPPNSGPSPAPALPGFRGILSRLAPSQRDAHQITPATTFRVPSCFSWFHPRSSALIRGYFRLSSFARRLWSRPSPLLKSPNPEISNPPRPWITIQRYLHKSPTALALPPRAVFSA